MLYELLPLLRQYLEEKLCGAASEHRLRPLPIVSKHVCCHSDGPRPGAKRSLTRCLARPTSRGSSSPQKGAIDDYAVIVHAKHVGASGEHWVEPFLTANSTSFTRLDIGHEIRADPELTVLLKPGARIGAVPLLSPSTRRVAAGLPD